MVPRVWSFNRSSCSSGHLERTQPLGSPPPLPFLLLPPRPPSTQPQCPVFPDLPAAETITTPAPWELLLSLSSPSASLMCSHFCNESPFSPPTVKRRCPSHPQPYLHTDHSQSPLRGTRNDHIRVSNSGWLLFPVSNYLLKTPTSVLSIPSHCMC